VEVSEYAERAGSRTAGLTQTAYSKSHENTMGPFTQNVFIHCTAFFPPIVFLCKHKLEGNI